MAQGMKAPEGDNGNPWKSGLCDCFDDCGICCFGTFLPCVLYGQNAEKITGESCFGHCLTMYLVQALCGCSCCITGPVRNRLRAQQQLKEDCCGDWCTHCWLQPCAICQEARQLQATSQDPTGAYAPVQGAGSTTMSAPSSQRMKTAV
ncbi:hypothetical protein WJX73_006652 [Symbiochloris irregularis]|uniref:Uncharacterized protein n=1 Tax=Symbiochloris irregularis TaxID=706552 RepID=A0AAW1NNL8_9CHLO